MAYKTCKCGKKCGVRSLKCPSCGVLFNESVPKKPAPPKNKLVKEGSTVEREMIEPGLWVLDKTKGMPNVSRPPSLSPTIKLNNIELRDHIVYEGLGYCIYNYITPNMILDKKIAKLWKEVHKIMIEIVGRIYGDIE